MGRLLDWLNSGSERRSVPREPGEGLHAFYWEGDAPHSHPIRDISRHGVYVETNSISWSPGTRMMLTLQIASNGCPNGAAPDAITLQAEVVRTYEDGMGLRFLLHAVGDRRLLLQFLARWQAHA